ncbi:MAG: hypothetical protein PVH99_00600 [Desulfobacteraceae bacterium]|jgi:hypothetical protein
MKSLRDFIQRLPAIALAQARQTGGLAAYKRKFLYNQVKDEIQGRVKAKI